MQGKTPQQQIRKIAQYQSKLAQAVYFGVNKTDYDKMMNTFVLGAIGVMEAGQRYAEDFTGIYDNVITPEEQRAQFRNKYAITGQNRSNTVDKRIEENKRKQEERNNRINNDLKGITYDGAQDGRCYVIFDDKAVDVIKTYY